MKSELIKPIHLARRAVVYIRQSTTHQVVTNQESLRLQYALRQRAIELGWPEAGIDVIDADLGISGASAAQRSGFKELVGRVGLKEVGLILSIDVTRLARNCSDWYPLLDICGLHGCLIADRDGVYDPGSANGRLLLGLKGTISELELHTIRSRLTAGLLAKAERGELALTLPIGLVRDPSGVVVKDPNLEVQERLELLFETFLKVRTIAKVMREFNDRGLELPRRDRHGDLHWARATSSAVAAILKNPAYAGAFVYGRTRLRRPSDGRLPTKVPKPIEQWRIIVKDRYPPYIAGKATRRSGASSATTEQNTCATRPGVLHVRANYCCKASHGAEDAVTRCTLATRGEPSTSAITCIRIKGCRHVNTSVLAASTPPWRKRSSQRWRRPRSTHCRALVALSNRRTKQCRAVPSSSSNAGAMKQRSPNVSSTASILTTGLSPPNSSAVGRWL